MIKNVNKRHQYRKFRRCFFTGNRKGILHLSGTPLLDSSRQVLSMPDISFDVDTKDMMLRIAQNLFHKKIMKQLQNQTVLDIAALIQKNKAAISQAQSTGNRLDEYNRHFSGNKTDRFIATKDYIQVQAYIRGNISLVGAPPASLLEIVGIVNRSDRYCICSPPEAYSSASSRTRYLSLIFHLKPNRLGIVPSLRCN